MVLSMNQVHMQRFFIMNLITISGTRVFDYGIDGLSRGNNLGGGGGGVEGFESLTFFSPGLRGGEDITRVVT